MRLKPGCGCLLMVLALINLFFFGSVIYSTVQGRFTGLGGFAMGALFLGNFAVVMTVGWGAFRTTLLRRRGDQSEAESFPETDAVEGFD